jgi:hypothetical protein
MPRGFLAQFMQGLSQQVLKNRLMQKWGRQACLQAGFQPARHAGKRLRSQDGCPTPSLRPPAKVGQENQVALG